MAKCRKCGSEWIPDPEKPVCGFTLQPKIGTDGGNENDHIFLRMDILACPKCPPVPKIIKTVCGNCGKPWDVEKDADLFLETGSGFRFRVPKGMNATAFDDEGNQKHPFERFEVVSCPSCRRSLADLVENGLEVKEPDFIEGKNAGNA